MFSMIMPKAMKSYCRTCVRINLLGSRFLRQVVVDRLGSLARKVSRLVHNGEKMGADDSQIYLRSQDLETRNFLAKLIQMCLMSYVSDA